MVMRKAYFSFDFLDPYLSPGGGDLAEITTLGHCMFLTPLFLFQGTTRSVRSTRGSASRCRTSGRNLSHVHRNSNRYMPVTSHNRSESARCSTTISTWRTTNCRVEKVS